jgi:hypothetical protein
MKKKSKPTYDNPETVVQFTFCGVTNRIVIFERGGTLALALQAHR